MGGIDQGYSDWGYPDQGFLRPGVPRPVLDRGYQDGGKNPGVTRQPMVRSLVEGRSTDWWERGPRPDWRGSLVRLEGSPRPRGVC